MNEWYNRHYITIDKNNKITDGFSDAFRQPSPDDICINERGETQFCLLPEGEENPPLLNANGVHLYAWDGAGVRETTEEERSAEMEELEASRPVVAPSIEEKVDLIGAQLSALMLESMNKNQTVEAIGSQLAQVSLAVMELKAT